MFLNNGVTQLVNSLNGVPLAITHVAIGDTTTVISLTDRVLLNEVYRKPISRVYSVGTSVYVEAFIDISEANFNWRQIGLFAGGTATKDSGQLIAEVLVNELKTTKKNVTITWELKINVGGSQV